MSGSLKDQLVKAGLVTADRARKVERQARAEKHARRNAKASPDAAPSTLVDDASAAGAKERARQLQREKAERDRAMARAANEQTAARALRAEIRQIIQQNDQRTGTTSDDDVAYNFVHSKRVKRIIVAHDDRAPEPGSDDEYYARFKVPDDLDW
jgi:uncharacterized protein